MRRFLESLCLILFIALLAIQVGSYFENKADEPKEEDPIVETPVEDESPEVLTLIIENGDNDITIEYEDGMTWLEWATSSYYNDILEVIIEADTDGVYYGDYSLCINDGHDTGVTANDLINSSLDYMFID